jgi:hypothetical protein
MAQLKSTKQSTVNFGRRQEASALASTLQSIFVKDDPLAANQLTSSSLTRLSLF